MTKAWLGWAAAVAVATTFGCGASPSTSFDGGNGDGAADATTDGHARHDGSSLTDSGGDDGAHDGTVHDASGVTDSLLDIDIPEGFTSPDSGTDTSVADTGVDSGCAPDSVTCSGSTAVTCKGGKVTKTKCSGATPTCAAGYGCVVCDPGSGGTCSGSTGTICASDGSGYTTSNCDPLEGLTCLGGTCTGDCADIGTSYIGCEYYAVTTANSLLDQGNFTFVVSIANTGSSSADINIQGGVLSSAMTATIPAGGIQDFVLPWVTTLSCGSVPCDAVNNEVPSLQGLPVTTTPPPTSIVTSGAYHIRSTEPVTVYQFNARDYAVTPTSEVAQLSSVGAGSTEYSFTNDASLLIPVNAMTGNYRVVGYYDWYWPGFIAIVGTQPGTTVTLAANTTILSGGVPGLSSTGGTVTLNAGDVLQVLTPGTGTINYGGDLSGSSVTASAPVEVIAGHDCTYIPNATAACDHLEQINFPVETLGTDYLVAVPYNDNSTPRQFVKIIGTVNATTLIYDGVSGEPATVNAGGVVTFETTSDFRVTASSPIVIGQYMESQQAFGYGCTSNSSTTCGDPSMTLAVATAQFRTSYPFTAPPNYEENWVNVIAPLGATVTITDTAPITVTTGTPIGTSGYYVANVALCAAGALGCTGNHLASSTSPFGIEVYGYGSYTSYMYPGGLNLNR